MLNASRCFVLSTALFLAVYAANFIIYFSYFALSIFHVSYVIVRSLILTSFYQAISTPKVRYIFRNLFLSSHTTVRNSDIIIHIFYEAYKITFRRVNCAPNLDIIFALCKQSLLRFVKMYDMMFDAFVDEFIYLSIDERAAQTPGNRFVFLHDSCSIAYIDIARQSSN